MSLPDEVYEAAEEALGARRAVRRANLNVERAEEDLRLARNAAYECLGRLIEAESKFRAVTS